MPSRDPDREATETEGLQTRAQQSPRPQARYRPAPCGNATYLTFSAENGDGNNHPF